MNQHYYNSLSFIPEESFLKEVDKVEQILHLIFEVSSNVKLTRKQLITTILALADENSKLPLIKDCPSTKYTVKLILLASILYCSYSNDKIYKYQKILAEQKDPIQLLHIYRPLVQKFDYNRNILRQILLCKISLKQENYINYKFKPVHLEKYQCFCAQYCILFFFNQIKLDLSSHYYEIVYAICLISALSYSKIKFNPQEGNKVIQKYFKLEQNMNIDLIVMIIKQLKRLSDQGAIQNALIDRQAQIKEWQNQNKVKTLYQSLKSNDMERKEMYQKLYINLDK